MGLLANGAWELSLVRAISEGDRAFMCYMHSTKSFIEGSEFHGSDEEGKTLLHIAVSQRRPDVIRYLRTVYQLDPNSRDHAGHTPMYDAVRDAFRDDDIYPEDIYPDDIFPVAEISQHRQLYQEIIKALLCEELQGKQECVDVSEGDLRPVQIPPQVPEYELSKDKLVWLKILQHWVLHDHPKDPAHQSLFSSCPVVELLFSRLYRILSHRKPHNIVNNEKWNRIRFYTFNLSENKLEDDYLYELTLLDCAVCFGERDKVESLMDWGGMPDIRTFKIALYNQKYTLLPLLFEKIDKDSGERIFNELLSTRYPYPEDLSQSSKSNSFGLISVLFTCVSSINNYDSFLNWLNAYNKKHKVKRDHRNKAFRDGLLTLTGVSAQKELCSHVNKDIATLIVSFYITDNIELFKVFAISLYELTSVASRTEIQASLNDVSSSVYEPRKGRIEYDQKNSFFKKISNTHTVRNITLSVTVALVVGLIVGCTYDSLLGMLLGIGITVAGSLYSYCQFQNADLLSYSI